MPPLRYVVPLALAIDLARPSFRETHFVFLRKRGDFRSSVQRNF